MLMNGTEKEWRRVGRVPQLDKLTQAQKDMLKDGIKIPRSLTVARFTAAPDNTPEDKRPSRDHCVYMGQAHAAYGWSRTPGSTSGNLLWTEEDIAIYTDAYDEETRRTVQ